MALSFWKVALRPGRPLMHGRLGAMHVLGLPGNPVSAFVCAVLFLVPLHPPSRRPQRSHAADRIGGARLRSARERRARRLPARDARPTGPTGLVATPFPMQDSSMLAPLAKADCLVIREPFAPAAEAGGRCTIVKFELKRRLAPTWFCSRQIKVVAEHIWNG